MTSTAPFSYSHVFNLSDCSLVEVMAELQTTQYFTLKFLTDNAEDANKAESAVYVKLEKFSTKEDSQVRKLVVFKNNISAITGNNAGDSFSSSDFEWQALFHIHSVIKGLGVEAVTRIVKPLASLPGAVEFLIPNHSNVESFNNESFNTENTDNENPNIKSANIKSSNMENSINSIADEHGLEVAFINSESKVPGLKIPALNKPGLLVMDMDSTAIQIECIDEIAKLAGVGEQVAAVTASAMRGELDFAESLHARVATLKGAPQSVITDVASKLPLMPGLELLVSCLKQHHWKIAIVSGGFTAMTEALKEQLGLDITLANNLDIKDAKLSGTVSGKVIDAQAKADAVLNLSKQFNIPMSQTIAMGDGANDLKMMAVASLGVAFHAKPLVCEQADVSVRQGGLDQLLYLIG
ncbi:phosphoserine phosphatase SerB [Psychrosphaera haliotis]|nr:phosphoserine phosphatase SerB [Psychrosphaera haliotis]